MSQVLVVTHWVNLKTLYRGGSETVNYKRYNGDRQINSQVTVNILPFTYPGQCYYFPSQGNQDRTDSTPGQMCVVLNLQPHPFFSLNEANLDLTLNLTVEEARDGFEHVVELLDGSPLVIRNPNGLQSSGQELIYPGYGFWSPYAGTYGCLRVKFNVVFRPIIQALRPSSYRGGMLPPSDPLPLFETVAGGPEGLRLSSISSQACPLFSTVSLSDTFSYSSYQWSTPPSDTLSSDSVFTEATVECTPSVQYVHSVEQVSETNSRILNGEVLLDRLTVCEQENRGRCEIMAAREQATMLQHDQGLTQNPASPQRDSPRSPSSLSTVILDERLNPVVNGTINNDILDTIFGPVNPPLNIPSSPFASSTVASERSRSPSPRLARRARSVSVDQILWGSQSSLNRARRRFVVELPPLTVARADETVELSSQDDIITPQTPILPAVPPNSPIGNVDLSRLFSAIEIPELNITPDSVVPSVVKRATYTPPANCEYDQTELNLLANDILEPVCLPVFSPSPPYQSRHNVDVSPDWLKQLANNLEQQVEMDKNLEWIPHTAGDYDFGLKDYGDDIDKCKFDDQPKLEEEPSKSPEPMRTISMLRPIGLRQMPTISALNSTQIQQDESRIQRQTTSQSNTTPPEHREFTNWVGDNCPNVPKTGKPKRKSRLVKKKAKQNKKTGEQHVDCIPATATTETNVTETNVTETNVTETNVTETNVTETNVTETNVTETNVTETNVTETNVNETNVTEGVTSETSIEVLGGTETTPIDNIPKQAKSDGDSCSVM